jgi:protein-disulfide isomerase
MNARPRGPALTLPVGARDHARGPASAAATLVEYGDYECPYCGQAYPIVKAVQSRLGNRLRFVFRNFPLSQMHPHAVKAAEAAEAAGEQGKFWEMHDTLFEHQDALELRDLIAYADRLGIDSKRVAAQLELHSLASRVREDFMSGVRSGVNGTPTFFLNGARYAASWDEKSLHDAIEEAIQATAGGKR